MTHTFSGSGESDASGLDAAGSGDDEQVASPVPSPAPNPAPYRMLIEKWCDVCHVKAGEQQVWPGDLVTAGDLHVCDPERRACELDVDDYVKGLKEARDDDWAA